MYLGKDSALSSLVDLRRIVRVIKYMYNIYGCMKTWQKFLRFFSLSIYGYVTRREAWTSQDPPRCYFPPPGQQANIIGSTSVAYCFDNRRGETCVDIYCRPQRSVQRVYRCIQAVIAIAPACRSAIALHLVLHCCNDTGEKTRWLQPMYQMETNHGPTEMVDEEISCFRTKMQ